MKKEIVSFNQFGNTYQYYPLVTKEAYSNSQMKDLVSNYFNNSFKKVVNFLSENKELDIDEVNEVMKMLEEIKEQKKKSK